MFALYFFENMEIIGGNEKNFFISILISHTNSENYLIEISQLFVSFFFVFFHAADQAPQITNVDK